MYFLLNALYVFQGLHIALIICIVAFTSEASTSHKNITKTCKLLYITCYFCNFTQKTNQKETDEKDILIYEYGLRHNIKYPCQLSAQVFHRRLFPVIQYGTRSFLYESSMENAQRSCGRCRERRFQRQRLESLFASRWHGIAAKRRKRLCKFSRRNVVQKTLESLFLIMINYVENSHLQKLFVIC